jgi:hypothetical protein
MSRGKEEPENPFEGLAELDDEAKVPLFQKFVALLEEGAEENDTAKIRNASLGLAAIKKTQGASETKVRWPEDYIKSVRLMALSDFAHQSELDKYRGVLKRERSKDSSKSN